MTDFDTILREATERALERAAQPRPLGPVFAKPKPPPPFTPPAVPAPTPPTTTPVTVKVTHGVYHGSSRPIRERETF